MKEKVKSGIFTRAETEMRNARGAVRYWIAQSENGEREGRTNRTMGVPRQI